MKMMSRNIFLVVVKVIHVRRTLSVLDWVHLVPLFFVMFNFCLILSLLRKTSGEHFWVQMWIRRKDEDFSRFLFLVVTYRHLRVYAGLSNKNVLFYVIITSHESSACQMSEVRITNLFLHYKPLNVQKHSGKERLLLFFFWLLTSGAALLSGSEIIMFLHQATVNKRNIFCVLWLQSSSNNLLENQWC